MNEIFVGGDIERALLKLKKKYAQEIGRSIASHLFFESRTQRKRRKRKRSIQRLKKLESRSLLRVDTAIRRESRDKRASRMDYVRD
jgi:ribosomal protein S21